MAIMHLSNMVTSTLLASRAVSPASTYYNTTIVLPKCQPSFAQLLSPQLAAFSIEMDRWPQWSGAEIGQPNTYFNQLLANLAERTGVPPHVRVGADSSDRAYLDLSVPVVNATFPNPTPTTPIPEASILAIGRDFYALSANLLNGTTFTWGINLKLLNLTETLAQAAHLADAFQGSRANITSNVHLANIEIGNEPDLYSFTAPATFTDATWTPYNYSQTWNSYAQAVSKVVNLSQTKLNAGVFALSYLLAGFSKSDVWFARGAYQDGIFQSTVANPYANVKSSTGNWASHLYSGAYGYNPTSTGTLMSKFNVRGNLTQYFYDIVATKAEGLPFILSETNSYANHGAPGISNGAEAAIWATDYMLQAASLGIERTHFHNGIGYRYNVLQPGPTTPEQNDGLNLTSRGHILPLYHAFLVVDEAIGTSGRTYVSELQTTNASLAAYGIWECGALKKAVLINSQVYAQVNGTLPATRLGLSVGLFGWSNATKTTVKRLGVPYTNAVTGLTWGNQTFDTVSGVPGGTVVEEVVADGVVHLEASSVILVTFGN